MKTAISIPDDVFEEAERAAERLGISRSQLYASAVRRFLEEQRGSWVTAKLNEVYANEEPDPLEDAFRLAAAQAVFARNEW